MARRTLRQMFDRFEERHPPQMTESQTEEERIIAWMDSLVQRAYGGALGYDEFNALSDLRVRVRELFARAKACVPRPDAGGSLPPGDAAEVEAARTLVTRQQEQLASYAARHEKDLERAEEFALRPHLLALLPILDALDLVKKDTERPDCDPQRVLEALGMVKDGLASHLASVRASLSTPT